MDIQHQREAGTSDLGDDQSRYLLLSCGCISFLSFRAISLESNYCEISRVHTV